MLAERAPRLCYISSGLGWEACDNPLPPCARAHPPSQAGPPLTASMESRPALSALWYGHLVYLGPRHIRVAVGGCPLRGLEAPEDSLATALVTYPV